MTVQGHAGGYTLLSGSFVYCVVMWLVCLIYEIILSSATQDLIENIKYKLPPSRSDRETEYAIC